MAALEPGKKAPTVQGLKPGVVNVVAFYKATCPTCQFAYPFLEKLYQHHKSDSVNFVSVAQEGPNEAKGFEKAYGITMPAILDQNPYPASSAYGLTNVPTVFLVKADGTIEQTLIGFVKKEYEALASKLANYTQKAAAAIFQGMSVPELKPG